MMENIKVFYALEEPREEFAEFAFRHLEIK